MRASWNGYFKLADVVLPIRLYSAITSTLPSFVQLHGRDHAPIRRITVCSQDGEELSADDIVRAVERDGRLVELSESDLARSHTEDKSIIVRQFAEPGAIDPIYYDKPYYMVPGTGGELAYTVLRQAFQKAGKVALVTYMYYERARLGIVRHRDGMLVLQQLHFADELLPRSKLKTPALPQPSPAQVNLAASLMERYASSFYIDDYRNNQVDELNELIDRKMRGLAPKRRSRVTPQTTPEDELTPALRALVGGSSTELGK